MREKRRFVLANNYVISRVIYGISAYFHCLKASRRDTLERRFSRLARYVLDVASMSKLNITHRESGVTTCKALAEKLYIGHRERMARS